MNERPLKHKPLLYVIFGFLLWTLVDWGTAGGFRFSYFARYGPALFLFYIGCPVVFAYLIYKRNWNGVKLLFATFIAILIIEGLFVRNPFVLSFPLLLFGVPLAFCVYAPLTFFPLWIVNEEMGRHKAMMILLSLIILIVMILTTFGKDYN